ncbi:MAG: pentapeptide repeat-containing protein [Methylomonas sp.]|nr:pentapeptide repeat-containing protein [Methylomonas sp.]
MTDTEKEIELEAKLLEQEHRLFHVLWNFFVTKKSWGKSDPRYISANKAILYRLLLSPAVVSTASGGAALFSVFLVLHQNDLMSKQNDLMEDQNKYFKQQIEFQSDQWNSQQINIYISTLYDKENNCLVEGCEVENVRAKVEAAIAFYALENLRIKSQFGDDFDKDVEHNPPYVPNLAYINLSRGDFSYSSMDRSFFSNSLLDYVDMRNMNLQRVNFVDSSIKESIFVSSNMNKCSMQRTKAYKATFRLADLSNCILRNGDFTEATFDESNMQGVWLEGAKLDKASFKGANISQAIFNKTDIKYEQLLDGCSNGGTQLPFDMQLRKCGSQPNDFVTQ